MLVQVMTLSDVVFTARVQYFIMQLLFISYRLYINGHYLQLLTNFAIWLITSSLRDDADRKHEIYSSMRVQIIFYVIAKISKVWFEHRL